MEMKPWRIWRLKSNEPHKVAKTLLGLYEIDIEAFKKQDQYGVDLLKLALLQPEAFWIASIDNELVGYLSIFMLRSASLYNRLVKEAKQGILNLPDLLDDYSKYMMSPTDYNLTSAHIYVDAIAIIRKKAGISVPQAGKLRSDLINAAKNDMALVNKATLCTIAIRPGICSQIEKLDTPLKHVGGRRETATRDKLYRELFACRDDSQKIFNRIFDALASIRWGVHIGVDQLQGTPTVTFFPELKN